MRSLRSTSKLAALLALTPLASAACGSPSASTDATSEATGSTSQAVVMADGFTLTPIELSRAVNNLLHVGETTVSLSNGALTVKPSSAMVGILALPASLSATIPTSLPISFSVPIIGNINGTVVLTSFSLNANSIALVMNSNGVAASAGWTAAFSISLPTLSNATVSLAGNFATEITPAAVAGSDRVKATGTSITITGSDSSCGTFDWCSGLLESVVQGEEGSTSTSLASALEGFMNKELAATSVTQAVDTGLDYFSNVTLNPGTGGTPWGVVPGTLQFNGAGANWSATHWIAPAPLTGCDAVEDCSGVIDAYCSSDMDPGAPGNDTQQLQRWDGSSWDDVGTLNDDDDPSAPVNETVTYRICASNPAGSTCSASFTVETFPATGCTSGGSGGGGGLGGHGPACGGQPCKAQ